MKRYQISVNDKEYTVEVDDPSAFPTTVRVNGKPFRVKISEQGVSVQGPTRPAAAAVELDEAYIPVVVPAFVEPPPEVAPETEEAASEASDIGGRLAAKESVTAPMPGKILDIVVRAGDRVKQGDTLCNLEAMKMKSPIRATADGAIAQVLVGEGQNVNYGDILFTLR